MVETGPAEREERRHRDFYLTVFGRRSVRRYLPRPVPPEVATRLLSAAAWAPSAHNRQPWRFVLLDDAAARDRLARDMGDDLARDRLADGDPPDLVAADVARSRARICGAPLVVVSFVDARVMDDYPDPGRARAEHLMAVQSVAMATQNLLLAAQAEGLGACVMCAPLFCGATVAATLGVASRWEAQGLVTLGYPAGPGKPGKRAPLDDLVVRPGPTGD